MEGGKIVGNLLKTTKDHQETHIDSWQDCYISDTKKTGFVCTFHLATKQHRFFGLNDLEHLMKEAYKKQKDVYLSLNAFEYGSRKIESLKQIRNIGVDLDCYKLGLSVEETIEIVKSKIFRMEIPEPNVLIRSGRGVQLIYAILGGASPDVSFLSKYITGQFIAELQEVGADTSATDVTRIFRLPYSINSRNGQQVKAEVWKHEEYDLQVLYSYCTPLERRRKPHKKRRGNISIFQPKPGTRTLYSLNTARKNDLDKLVELRQGNIEKRNVMTYIYAYTTALNLKNKKSTIEFALHLNDRFADPQKSSEVKRTAGNAYDDAMTFFTELEKRDFVMWYQSMDGIKRPMKNEKVIKELDITPDEIKQLETIINSEEKQMRNTSYQRNKRRTNGVLEREKYIEEQQSKTEKQIKKLKELITEKPKATQKELAIDLGVSTRHIRRLKNHI